jgi:hypothetical protein
MSDIRQGTLLFWFLITLTLYYNLKPRSVMLPDLLFFHKIALVIQGVWWFSMNFRTILSIPGKTPGNFDMDCIDFVHCFGNTDILAILILIYECKMSFFLFVYFYHFLRSSQCMNLSFLWLNLCLNILRIKVCLIMSTRTLL